MVPPLYREVGPVAAGQLLLFLSSTSTGPFSRLLVLLLLHVSVNVHTNSSSASVRPTTSKFPCFVCVREIGRTAEHSFSVAAVRGGSIPPALLGLPGLNLSSMFSQGDVGGWVC